MFLNCRIIKYASNQTLDRNADLLIATEKVEGMELRMI